MELFKERRSDKDRRKTKLHAPFPLLDFKSRRIEKERRVTFDRRVEGLGLSVADAPKKRVSQTIPTIPRGSRYK